MCVNVRTEVLYIGYWGDGEIKMDIKELINQFNSLYKDHNDVHRNDR